MNEEKKRKDRVRHIPDAKRIEVVDPDIAAILRQKTPAERIEMIFAANRTMRMVIEGRLRTDHPEWTDAEIQVEIARRICPEIRELESQGLVTIIRPKTCQ